MKILILGRSNERGLEASYARALRAVGVEVEISDPHEKIIEWRAWRNLFARRFLEKKVIARFNQSYLDEIIAIDADVLLVFKGALMLPEFWRAFKSVRPKTILVCYNPDDPVKSFSRGSNRPWITASIPVFDLFCTYKSSISSDLHSLGAENIAVIPFAWDPQVHPMQEVPEGSDDVVFIGNGDSYRAKVLAAIMADDRTRAWRVAVYGNWTWFQRRQLSRVRFHGPIEGEQMASIVAEAKTSLNILRLQNEGSHNMRTFEVPGAGGLLVSQFSEEQDSFFPADKAAVYFRSPANAVDVLERLLTDPEKRACIRSSSRNAVVKHTYEMRARQLILEIEKLSG